MKKETEKETEKRKHGNKARASVKYEFSWYLGSIALKFENVQFPDSIGFKCKKCGACCRQQPADLTIEEQKEIEAQGYKDFLDAPDSVADSVRIIRRKNDGSCFFLGSNNECMIYEIRPSDCRLAPFTISDWDYEKNTIEIDLPIEHDCKGISDKGVLPIEEMAKAAQTTIKYMTEILAKILSLPATDKKVLSRTRILIREILNQHAEVDMY